MSLEIEYGPMFAGKSTALISKLTRYADVGLKCVYVNHSKDIRLTESSDQVVSTHNSTFQKLSHKIQGVKVSYIWDVNVEGKDVIGIDEGQFFYDKEQIYLDAKGDVMDRKYIYDETIETIRRWVLVFNLKVIIASLDSDYKLRPFGCIHQLIGLCGKSGITKHVAICVKCDPMDRADAPYTMKIAGEDSIIDPGGADKYVPVCPKCYKKYNKYW